MAVPHTGSEAWTSQLGNTLGVETPWAPWHTGDHQVGCWLIGWLFRCWVGLAVGWGGAGELGWLGLAACLSASRMDAKAQLATQLSSANCQLPTASCCCSFAAGGGLCGALPWPGLCNDQGCRPYGA